MLEITPQLFIADSKIEITAIGHDLSAPGDADVVSGPLFDAGTYDLSESTGPAGYTRTITCSNSSGPVTTVTLALADDVTCTYDFDDIAPTLTLEIGLQVFQTMTSPWVLQLTRAPAVMAGYGMSIVELAREELRALQPYEAAQQVDSTIRLNANEAPWTSSGDRFRRPSGPGESSRGDASHRPGWCPDPRAAPSAALR